MTRWLLYCCAAVFLCTASPVHAQVEDLPLAPLEPQKKKRKKRGKRRKKPPRVRSVPKPAPESGSTPESRAQRQPDSPPQSEVEPALDSEAAASQDSDAELAAPAPAPSAEEDPIGDEAPPLDELDLELAPVEIAPAPEEKAVPPPVTERPVVVRPAEPRGRALFYAGVTALGAGVVAAGVGTVFGLRASEFDDLGRGATGASQIEARAIRDDSESAASLANASFIAAGALGGAGLGLLLYHYLSDDEPALELTPEPSGATLWLRGSF